MYIILNAFTHRIEFWHLFKTKKEAYEFLEKEHLSDDCHKVVEIEIYS